MHGYFDLAERLELVPLRLGHHRLFHHRLLHVCLFTHLVDQFRCLGFGEIVIEHFGLASLLAQGFQIRRLRTGRIYATFDGRSAISLGSSG